MSNFYDDFLYDKKQLTVLKKALSGGVELIRNQLEYVDNLNTVKRIPTYKIIPIFQVDMTNALYDLSDILNKDFSIIGINITPDMHINERLRVWNELSVKDKINMLDYSGVYIALTNQDNFIPEDAISIDSRMTVEALEIHDKNGAELIYNIDYSLKDNKVYMLREFTLKELAVKKECTLKNIVIDLMTTEDILGESIGIPYDANFTKTDYNETLKSFTMSALKGSTLGNLKQSLGGHTALAGVDVVDYKSAEGVKKYLWERVDGLSRFDFVISIPPKIIVNEDKLKYVKLFFDKIKPAYTNYVFVPEQKIEDHIYMNKIDTTISFNSSSKLKDNLVHRKDAVSMNQYINLFEHVNYLFVKKTNDDYAVVSDVGVRHDSLNFAEGVNRSVLFDPLSRLSSSDAFNRSIFSTNKDNIEYKERQIFYLNFRYLDRMQALTAISANNDDIWLTDDTIILDAAYMIDKGPRLGFTINLYDEMKKWDDGVAVIPIVSPLEKLHYGELYKMQTVLSLNDQVQFIKGKLFDSGVIFDTLSMSDKMMSLSANIKCNDTLISFDGMKSSLSSKTKDNIHGIDNSKITAILNPCEHVQVVPSIDADNNIFFDTLIMNDKKVTISQIPKTLSSELKFGLISNEHISARHFKDKMKLKDKPARIVINLEIKDNAKLKDNVHTQEMASVASL